MGYQQGEVPRLNVHGYEVAGATFPVPIWHAYMAAALWNHPAIDFATPDKYPTFRYWTKSDWGSVRSYYVPTYTTNTTTTTATTPAPRPAKPHGKRKLRTGPQ